MLFSKMLMAWSYISLKRNSFKSNLRGNKNLLSQQTKPLALLKGLAADSWEEGIDEGNAAP